ncbi:hypothetical protein SAMN04488518_11334 [Pseudovibrio ascidiaceicola]|uniref:DUF4412 domain-containing protein n=1 Tax=Pseudovibrio ascidiaceicola TaxID=285279 RepID=A0A1I4E0W3_9HYPH|nr:hypothetical protein [Pseudovibrio ascidiaceicola]SFK98006.1 hypothetical protein SAMN04488518_11334 [Pseudovibrio ascidiaceicola]
MIGRIAFAAATLLFATSAMAVDKNGVTFSGASSVTVLKTINSYKDIKPTSSKNKLTFAIDRHGNSDAANLFKSGLYMMNMDNFLPSFKKANLAAEMDLKFTINGKDYTVSSLRLAQYHDGWNNPWAIGGKNCIMLGRNVTVNKSKASTVMGCSALDENNKRVTLFFQTVADNKSLNYDEIKVSEGAYGSL